MLDFFRLQMPTVAMNFTEPQQPLNINGFRVNFKEITLKDGLTLWVPSRISRNEPSSTWRIAFYSTEAPKIEYFPDGVGTPEESLSKAWSRLVHLMETNTHVHGVDERPRALGPSRISLTKTGVTGVLVLRLRSEQRWPVVVVACQQLERANGRVRSRQVSLQRITRAKYLNDPEYWAKRFDQALKEAVALRRYYNEVYSQSGVQDRIITLDDVPARFRELPYEHTLDLDKIMWSF